MPNRKSNKHLINERGLVVCEFCSKEVKPLGYSSHRNSKHLGIKYSSQINPWNKGLTKETDDRVQKYVDTLKANDSYKKHYEESLGRWVRDNPEEYHKASSRGGGYRERAGRSRGDYRIDSYGNKVWVQSSYEILCADILDELKIKWIRPKPIFYELDNKKKLYYPDFYLIEYNLYLDPKNEHRIDKDHEKIKIVSSLIRLKVLPISSINKDFILSLIGS